MTNTGKIGLGVVALGVVAVGWWLGSPLFLDRTVEEAFPLAADAVVPDSMTRDEVAQVMSRAAETDVPMNEAMPPSEAAPMAVKTGRFRDADGFHRGSGSATIYRLPPGGHVLRFEDFMVTNGPDLRVLLSPHPDPTTRDDLRADDYVELARLKGNIGNQNYVIPTEIDIAAQRSVVIYCRPFHVIFSVASLR